MDGPSLGMESSVGFHLSSPSLCILSAGMTSERASALDAHFQHHGKWNRNEEAGLVELAIDGRQRLVRCFGFHFFIPCGGRDVGPAQDRTL